MADHETSQPGEAGPSGATAGDPPASRRDLPRRGSGRRGAIDGVDLARARHGGIDVAACFAGLLASLGVLVLIGGIAAAAGTVAYQAGSVGAGEAVEASTGALIAGVVVVVLSFATAGWVTGRVARYDGGLNGAVMAASFVVLAGLLAGLGAWLGERYDVLTQADLPQWFGTGRAGTEAFVSGLVGALVAIVAGWLGGRIGTHWHESADALVVGGDRLAAEHRTGRRDGRGRAGDVAWRDDEAGPSTVSGRGATDLRPARSRWRVRG